MKNILKITVAGALFSTLVLCANVSRAQSSDARVYTPAEIEQIKKQQQADVKSENTKALTKEEIEKMKMQQAENDPYNLYSKKASIENSSQQKNVAVENKKTETPK